MDLKAYFDMAKGTGVIATADENGKVNLAIYSKPHFMDNDEIAFIMTDKLTHNNLLANGNAAYLFKEEGEGHKGKRLYLTKLSEEKDSDLLNKIRSQKHHSGPDNEKSRFLVYFRVDKVLPLIGDGA
jgi:hypothetical protein